MSRRLLISLASALSLSVSVLGGVQATGATDPAAARSGQPNVLLIVTNNQSYRHSGLEFLDAIEALDSVAFTNAFNTNPIGDPGRATLLTGLYDHNTGIVSNGLASSFDDSNTIATWFDDAGYRTGLYGKYLIGYPFGSLETPDGWDDWRAFFKAPSFYGFELVENGSRQQYPDGSGINSTELLAEQVEALIANPSSDPFFAVYSPRAVHPPLESTPAHEGSHAQTPVDLPENFNERSAGAPSWTAGLEPVDKNAIRRQIRGGWETLESVDDAVEGFVNLLTTQGELDETIIVFMSDTGMSLGSHRWPKKTCGWEECIHVPFLISAPGIGERTERALVSNVDLAPTLADLAGIPAPAVDGESLGPLLREEVPSLGRDVLLHHSQERSVRRSDVPTFDGIRTKRWKLLDYESEEPELYDLRNDPFELLNLAGKSKYRPVMRRLRAAIRELRGPA